MSIYLQSVQIAKPRPIDLGDRRIETGIFKEPVREAQLGSLGLEGDAVVNTKHHGGPDQAVYVYSAEDYRWWESALGIELVPGTFGENLTFSSFGPDPVLIGDRWAFGEVVLETTAPRIPCATFGAKMDDPAWPKRFRAARRPGFYARVIIPGLGRAGMEVTRRRIETGLPLLELQDLFYDRNAPVERLERALAAPIAERDRADLERRLGRT